MYTYIYIRLHLIKICLCCFLDMHLYSTNLSIIACNSSLVMLEIFPACLSCNNSFNLLQNSSGSVDKKLVFETLGTETIKPGDISNVIRVLSGIY